MTKQETLNALGKILSDNIGNRLTMELANGIIASFAQAIPDAELTLPVAEVDS